MVQISEDKSRNRVKETGDGLLVSLRSQPGKENAALECVLSKHFDIDRSAITIVEGNSSQKKLVEIEKDPK